MAISAGADICFEIGERRCKMGDFALWEAFGSVQNDRQVLGLIFKHRKDNANS